MSYQQPSFSAQQPPLQPFPHAQAPKRKRPPIWAIVVGLIVTLVLCNCIDSVLSHESSRTTDTQPTQTVQQQPAQTGQSAPTHAPTFVTIKTFSGHLSGGNWYDTPFFSVPKNWQVRWTCQHGESSLPLVTIAAYDHSGHPISGDDERAAHGNCNDGSGIGAVQKQGGTIHLHIYAQGDWSVSVAVLKEEIWRVSSIQTQTQTPGGIPTRSYRCFAVFIDSSCRVVRAHNQSWWPYSISSVLLHVPFPHLQVSRTHLFSDIPE